MAQISIIKKSNLGDNSRFDADYYKPDYLKFDILLSNINTDLLVNLSEKITDFGAYSQNSFVHYLDSGNYYFIRNKDVNDFFLADSNRIFISEQAYNKLTLKMEEFDLLLQRTGTIGQSAIVLKKDLPSSANQNLAKVKIDRGKINPFCVLAFLNSKYGKMNFERLATGNVQPWLNLSQIERIRIPLFSAHFQELMQELILNSFKMGDTSKKLILEAENLLLKEINLFNQEIKHALSFEAKKCEVEEGKRIDSEYHQPKYKEILDKIESYSEGFDIVKNLFKQNKSLSKKNKEFYNYVEISDINVSTGEIIPTKRLMDEIPANGKIKLKKNDLLISKVRPYRGAVSFIDFEDENLLGSGAFTVLSEKTNYKKEVLMVFLRTKHIKELLLRYNCGTSYPVIKDEDILNLRIPLIKEEIQNKIAEKVLESFKLQKESKNILDEAKRMIEEEIEKEARIK